MGLYEEFKSRFRPYRDPEPPELSTEEAEETAEEKRIRLADFHAFFTSQALKDLESWLEVQVEANEPRPDLGTDSAACYSFKQAGIRMVQKKLETMRRSWKETFSE